MSVTVKDATFARSVMFLFLGTAGLLLLLQIQASTLRPGKQPVRAMISTPRRPQSIPRKTVPVASAVVPADSAEAVVDLSERRVYLYRQKKVLNSYPLAVGQSGWETPTGSFRVMHMQKNPEWMHPITGEVVKTGADNPLGTRWIGFWSDGQAEIGFHGTNQEELIGQAVSHGCLRMRNQDVESLYQHLKEGSIVTVRQ